MALVPAILLSIGYVILAFPLWLYGVLGITQWWVERVKEIGSPNLESPEKIIYDLKSYPSDENGDENGDFSVKDLVKMTSGLELDEFPRVIKSRDLAMVSLLFKKAFVIYGRKGGFLIPRFNIEITSRAKTKQLKQLFLACKCCLST